MPLAVRELELDLDAFEGPFDLLLTLVLRDELPLREVDLAEVVIAFVERLAERDELDLDACGEFLVLISALLELKARALFPEEDAELAELEPEEAAEELARRLAEYRRAKEARGVARRAARGGRRPLLPPRPGAARARAPEPRLAPQEPEKLAAALRALAAEPPAPSTAHMALRFPPVAQFLERWRALLRRRRRFDFDQEVAGLSRVEVAVAFLALLELRKQDELELAQAAPVRADQDFPRRRTKGASRGPSAPPDRRAIRSTSSPGRSRRCSSSPRSRSPSTTSSTATEDDPERVETALELLGERYREGRSGIVLERVAGGLAFRASREAAEACARLFDRPVERGLSQRGARDARDRRLPRPVLAAPRSPASAASTSTASSPASSSAACIAEAGRERRVRRGPLPHDAALRARLRARVARGAAAPRRPRRRRDRDPRAASRRSPLGAPPDLRGSGVGA